VLDKVIEGRELDFCLLVSSLSSILGGLRYAAYASANAFMDAFACGRNRTSPFPWLAVNWDAWLRQEDEERLKASKSPITGFVMTGAEGIDALHRVLSVDAGGQIVVSTGDLRSRIEQWVSLDALKKAEAKPTMRHPRPNLQTEFVAPRNDLETSIAGIWQELLGIEAVGVNDNFFELGGDSFLGIQLISKLKSELGVKVSAVTLYEGPRVSLMAEIVGPRSNGTGEAGVVDSSRKRGEKRRERKLRQGADAQAGESEEAMTEALGA
jgi:acyl carrier protein